MSSLYYIKEYGFKYFSDMYVLQK